MVLAFVKFSSKAGNIFPFRSTGRMNENGIITQKKIKLDAGVQTKAGNNEKVWYPNRKVGWCSSCVARMCNQHWC